LKNDFLEFLENSQPFRLSLVPWRPGKNLKNDFLEISKIRNLLGCPWTPAGTGKI
ncbi:hypothetical protein T11_14916, partial [Trichinella zimbabwensis]